MAYTHQDSPSDAVNPETLPALDLPSGVTSRYVDTSSISSSGIVFHILESLPSNPGPNTKLIVCIHGFPEFAYSWRKILPQLSAAGYHAIAFDQRGYGRTYSRGPLEATSFRPLNLIRDTVALISALGYPTVSSIVGHDFGAVTAALCALSRPDLFKSLVLMSHPSRGAPQLPMSNSPSYADPKAPPPRPVNIHADLAHLSRPRKHYQWYYCTTPANADMTYPSGAPLHAFLRGYFHLKSADWPLNDPRPLRAWSADALQEMPRYYIMDLSDTMRQAVERDMAESKQTTTQVKELGERWLPDDELAVYVEEWTRTTFTGGLNWYRVQTQPSIAGDVEAWSGAKISVPTVFVSGKRDWGTYQDPGAVQAMEEGKSVKDGYYRGTVLVDGAGHWVNQEQPGRCVEEILKIAREADS